jgi:hypothetical protein
MDARSEEVKGKALELLLAAWVGDHKPSAAKPPVAADPVAVNPFAVNAVPYAAACA